MLFRSAGFTGLEAYAISVVVSFYQSRLVLQAVLITAGLFIGLTLFACQTKYDFTSWMPYLFGTLWALILFGFMAMFFPHNSTVELAYSGIAALLFSAYILVDTQLIMRHYHVEEEIAVSSATFVEMKPDSNGATVGKHFPIPRYSQLIPRHSSHPQQPAE